MRYSLHPDYVITSVGVRPGCFSPPAPFTVRAVGRDSSGSARRVQTRGSRPAPVIGLPIRTTPVHCPMAIEPGCLVGFLSCRPRGAWARGGQPRLAQSAAGLIPSALRWARKQPTFLISGRTSVHLQQPLKDQLPIHGVEFPIGLPLQAGLPQAGVAARETGDSHGHLCSAGMSLLRIWERGVGGWPIGGSAYGEWLSIDLF